jgi:nucleoside-diphosphate-sugar epimerase
VLNICRAIAARPVRRVVFFSSAAVRRRRPARRHRRVDRGPADALYGIGKFTAERLLVRAVAQKPGTSLLILRPALVYGPPRAGLYYGPSASCGWRSPIRRSRCGATARNARFLFIDDVVALRPG